MKTDTNWNNEGEVKYLVVWTEYDGKDQDERATTDHYEAFVSLDEAKAKYDWLLDENGERLYLNTHSVHICAVVDSSDYSAHPALLEVANQKLENNNATG